MKSMKILGLLAVATLIPSSVVNASKEKLYVTINNKTRFSIEATIGVSHESTKHVTLLANSSSNKIGAGYKGVGSKKHYHCPNHLKIDYTDVTGIKRAAYNGDIDGCDTQYLTLEIKSQGVGPRQTDNFYITDNKGNSRKGESVSLIRR